MSPSTSSRKDGVSLAKAPVAATGMLFLAYGATGLLFGGSGFETQPIDGTVAGESWLGLEGNGWTNLLFIIAGTLLVAGSAWHRPAKTMALLVGLALGAASIIAVFDGDDVFGIFAANGWTMLTWGVAALVLLALARMPRRRREEPTPPQEMTPGLSSVPSHRELMGRGSR